MFPLALALAIAALQPLPPKPRNFGDWAVGCDNRRDCGAVAFADPYEENRPPFIGVIIERRADASAEPKAYIDTRFAQLDNHAGQVVADGKPTGLMFDKDGELQGSSAHFASVLAYSTSVVLAEKAGKTVARFRTNGASAALRWMDERQKRAGTVTAIVAKGPIPAAAVPAPPLLPTIRVPANSAAAPRRLTSAQIAAVRRRYDLCDDPRPDIRYHRVDAAHSIAIVNCWNGPYQSDGIIVLVPDRGGHRLASIEAPTAAEAAAPVVERSRLISPDYDKDRRLLYSDYRGRGLNDCGAHASWAWDGTRFRLASYAALDECRAVTARLPHWQTTNDPAAADE